MTEYDEIKIRDCKEDMDTLLVFVRPLHMNFDVVIHQSGVGRFVLRCLDGLQHRTIQSLAG